MDFCFLRQYISTEYIKIRWWRNLINSFKVAAVQMQCDLADKAANLNKAMTFIQAAVQQNVTLIVFPELFSTGYAVNEYDWHLAESMHGETVDKLCRLCSEYGIYVAGSMIEKGETRGTVYNTAFLLGPDVLIGKYRKVHLWDGEKSRFMKGDDFPVFETEIGKIGLQICYDVGFPEGARILSLKGADLLLYPAAYGEPRLYAWDIATRARALENGVYVIAANRTGQDRNIAFAAHSRIISPDGSILASIEQEEGMIVSELDHNVIDAQRRAIPYLNDLEKEKVYNHLREGFMNGFSC